MTRAWRQASRVAWAYGGLVGVAEPGEGVGFVVAVAEVPDQVQGVLVEVRARLWWPRWWWA
jgi:hypothetical protein